MRHKINILLIMVLTLIVIFGGSVYAATIGCRQIVGILGGLDNPYKIAIASNGYIYVADTENNRIIKSDKAGKLLISFGVPGIDDGQFSQPQGIVVDPNGYIYVADTGNDRIQELYDDGEKIIHVKTIAQLPDGTTFKLPRSIKLDDKKSLYIVDTSNNRIIKVTSSSRFHKS